MTTRAEEVLRSVVYATVQIRTFLDMEGDGEQKIFLETLLALVEGLGEGKANPLIMDGVDNLITQTRKVVWAAHSPDEIAAEIARRQRRVGNLYGIQETIENEIDDKTSRLKTVDDLLARGIDEGSDFEKEKESLEKEINLLNQRLESIVEFLHNNGRKSSQLGEYQKALELVRRGLKDVLGEDLSLK